MGGCFGVGCSAVGRFGVQGSSVVYFGGENSAEGDFVVGDFGVGNLVMKQALADWVFEVSAYPVVCFEIALVPYSAIEV